MSGVRSLRTAMMGLGSALGLLIGCQDTQTGPARIEQTAKPVASASTEVTGKVAPISLFGDLPDASAVPFEGKAAAGLQQHPFTGEGADFDPDVERTGQLLVFASTCHSPRADIYIKAIGETAITQLTDDPASDVQPRLSPDGKHVAFCSDRTGNWDIWVTSIDGQMVQQLTKSPAAEIHPDWSPDGQRLVYCLLNPQNGQWELWTLDLRHTGTRKFIGYGLFPRWSPKDDVIVYQRARARGNRWFSIWTIRLVDGEPRFPTEVAASSDHALIAPTWTTDGTRIVYCSVDPASPDGVSVTDRPVRGDLWITDADGRGKIRLTKGDAVNYSPVCGADGRVYFASNRSGSENIWSIVPIRSPSPVADARPGQEARANGVQ